MQRAVLAAFDGRGHDVWGMVFLVAGLVSGLAIFFDLGGPLGQFIDDSSGFLVGLLRVLMPPALIGLGVLLIRSGGDKDGAYWCPRHEWYLDWNAVCLARTALWARRRGDRAALPKPC